MRQNLIDQQSGTIRHPPCATTGAEATSLTAESDQFFIVARLTPYPEKAMLKSSTLQVFIKFFRYIGWQEPARPRLRPQLFQAIGLAADHQRPPQRIGQSFAHEFAIRRGRANQPHIGFAQMEARLEPRLDPLTLLARHPGPGPGHPGLRAGIHLWMPDRVRHDGSRWCG